MNSPAQNLRTAIPAEGTAALLSALADGDGSALHHACAAWREDEEARSTWHLYHLIGDVLRSDELAAAPARDAAFLSGLRARLAAEPVVLAPVPVRRRKFWVLPAAAAAGFVAVAGMMVVVRALPPAGAPALTASAGSSSPGLILAATAQRSAAPIMVSNRMIRDERLDSYLRAHREALGGPVLAAPGGMPRPIETLAPVSLTAPQAATH